MAAILPCPFCGNDKNIAVANEKHDHSGGYFIACPKCDASTGLRFACGDDPVPLLVEQWNRRTPPAPQAMPPVTLPKGWALETGTSEFDGTRWVCVRNLESQCGQDFYEDRDPLIFGFLNALAIADDRKLRGGE